MVLRKHVIEDYKEMLTMLNRKSSGPGFVRRCVAAVLLSCLGTTAAMAQDTVCAKVKIEIKQELTLERQAFDAEMKINNTTDTGVIENVSVVVKVTDENGVPVRVSSDPNDLTAKFFIRLSSKENISDVDGAGVVNPKTSSVIDWLLIPAPGAAGSNPLGKKYLVGATLKYKFGGEDSVLDVSPDVITVKPLPQLTLDYFLTRDVQADDPLTTEIEPAQPFTLGVRVRNNGIAIAKNLKIDSAQPKIVENTQGLLINFTLTGSYVDDAPVQNSLLVNFGDIAASTSKTGRWTMETTLAGKFTEFTARFTHADELGGALTSILQATNAHLLLHDVRVDLPGRDFVRDFLALDGDVLRVYESDSTDTVVTDRSAAATLTGSGDNYRLSFPATAGFVYVKLPDPYKGAKALGAILRSDGKQMAPENVWLSRTRNEQSKQWEYWFNVFDVNTTGVYDSAFTAPPAGAQAPVLQFIADQTVNEGKQVSFIVEASSPDGKQVAITAESLPAGATLTQAPASSGLVRAVFDWTPPTGSAGSYPIRFIASDGALSAARTATITVQKASMPSGPGMPTIDAPLAGATLYVVRPSLSVQTAASPGDPTTQVQFELYADEAGTQLVASGAVGKAAAGTGTDGAPLPAPTVWTLPSDLDLDKPYWWRARAFDGKLYSPWAYARFLVTSNSAPSVFNQTSPAADSVVSTLNPRLSWTNSKLQDGEALTYTVSVYKDAAMTQLAAEAANVQEDPAGATGWTVTPALADHASYTWRVVAVRATGGKQSSVPRAFSIDTSRVPLAAPQIASPAQNGVSSSAVVTLAAGVSSSADSYVFEIDRVNSFDSPAKRSSATMLPGADGPRWTPPALEQNARYWWRVKAQSADGSAASDWAVGQFLVSSNNEAPPAPTIRNPGNGAWSASLHPSLQASAVKDPEDEAVTYQFEVYGDAAMTVKRAEGSSAAPGLIVPVQLSDKTWYWWRVRAVDAQNAASAWSAPASLYVDSASVQAPAIAVVSPSAPLVVKAAAGQPKQVTIRWEGVDPTAEPTVSLYYGTARSGYTGTPIVEGLHQLAGAQSGSYVWDVSTLAPGAYRVYAVAFDSRGVGRAYAPGSVVIPNPATTATLKAAGPGTYGESGSGTVGVSWTGVSGQPMVVPLSANTYLGNKQYLNETAPKASASRLMTMVYPFQCSKQGKVFPLQAGPLITEDPNLAGLVSIGNTSSVTYAASNTGNETLRVCDISVVAERPVDATQSDFTVTARLSNLGGNLAAAVVTPIAGTGLSASGTLTYGVIGSGETGTPAGTVTIRAYPGISGVNSILRGMTWSVQPTPLKIRPVAEN
jgi:hypothetical protein